MARGTLMTKGLELRGGLAIIRSPFPLMGHIGFGVIDRGYNNLQVRITSLCGLSCIFCSVNAGPSSPRVLEFIVDDEEWLAEWVSRAIAHKGSLHVLFDGAGDPIAHPRLTDMIRAVSDLRGVESVALETRLHGASPSLLEKLAEAGVSRINLSIDSLDPNKARMLAGTQSYDIEKVVRLALIASKDFGIDIHITPVWIPGVNDHDIEEILEFAIKNELSRRYPPLGIQKYVIHRRGRKIPGVKEWSWRYFFTKLKELEERFGVRLVLRPEDFGLRPAPRVPQPYVKGETVKLVIVGQGWLPGEFLGVSLRWDRVFTLIDRRGNYRIGDVVIGTIIRDEDGILIAKPA